MFVKYLFVYLWIVYTHESQQKFALEKIQMNVFPVNRTKMTACMTLDSTTTHSPAESSRQNLLNCNPLDTNIKYNY